MKWRFWLTVLLWTAILILAIRYAHLILMGFAGLFLLGALGLTAAYFYLRHLWKKTEKQLKQMAQETENAFATPQEAPVTETLFSEGPVIHIQAETVHKSP
ncbi:hypothetical protein COW36_11965 [bacterium (Candidatus Blackallbacteria) CG17_big_fil_post_rev_8_21_14_2_50_48_46]|uniref:Uncharacterized protein n=1 Tax=bacterium (Candidatus Blackallbacteria) CG17_big_fil_post_rev_8_21_14_2_50_48_46 TaxID=2014261 RepID=A0A2M7G3N4_9BACT|nr:MAG: hypothetical protein COW64_03295 [bacterium (Candidatus Blackallbacteria) CG18_big_fil_WC_8_21_14_2_50_49_26]PIW16479.1 MAG: hypothetical protein COW36_11965 [bacterium (Candidatus Blackallbacteria) CG17_big_fil_post_rev_8_21_14_2_50_48_46]PIW45987.1 MAG: hypothetical protein COW20_17230 [bacterium (Candidatus Blackallbacteria) CG13_big_fil_rev_8_21_14_2_50_49_14]